jgi:HSP20 family molecular chaperone IbpA
MRKSSVHLEEHDCAPGGRSVGQYNQHYSLASRYIWIHDTYIWRPPTDVYETELAVWVQVEVAGMEESDFTVVLDGSILKISGSRPGHPERRVYHQLEIHTGEFFTEVELPFRVEAKTIRAKYHDGFLVVDLAKSQAPSVDETA